jgi:phosphopantothenoylcysteine decarboxylase/phosphopantothenate--cysteine ligase
MNIVVGVSGGIAAYKAVGVVRGLVESGHDVHVVPTEAALRFIGRPTWEAVSRNPVTSDLFDGVAEVRHVALGQAADLILIVPATANTLARLAAGLADDLLGTTVLASTAPVLVAPAMHTEMWQNAATQASVATLRARGVEFVGPAVGRLTGADTGVGRLSEPDEIVQAAVSLLARGRDLADRSILISAGGTREPLDPVRFVGNRSTGRQGVALAVAAAARGADVTLVAANLEIASPPGVRVVAVSTALELQSEMTSRASAADVVVMAAAVADYRPSEVSETKIKKSDRGDALTLTLVKNPDILRGLVEARVADQTIVGFAAETETDDDARIELARRKLAAKGCDLLVLNRVGWTETFGTEATTVVVLDSAGDIVAEAGGSKRSVADRILDLLPVHD